MRHFPAPVILKTAVILAFIIACTGAARRRTGLSPGASRPTSSSSFRYDRSITTFADDGRMLQVEYSLEAAHRRGANVACFQWDFDEDFNDSDENAEVLEKRRPPVVCIAIEDTTTTQDSQDQAQLTLTTQAEKVHRIDHHALLLTTGLAGDGRVLAQSIRLFAQRYLLSQGVAPSVRVLAEEVAETQHLLTRSPGGRPLAVSAIILGVNPIHDGNGVGDKAVGDLEVFQSDPGGVARACYYCASGRNQKEMEKRLAELWKLLRDSKKNKLPKLQGQAEDDKDHEKAELLRKIIHHTAMAVLQPTKDNKQIDQDKARDLQSQAQQEQSSDQQHRAVDLWLVQPSVSHRGHARMAFAKAVKREDLPFVTSKFMHQCEQ